MALNRSALQELARKRLREARALMGSGHYDGAYYLTGLAVECALKACIARKTRRHDFPDLTVVKDSYTHNLPKLLTVAGLVPEMDRDARSEPQLNAHWAVVKEWTVDSRYATKERQEACELYRAVAGRRHGVLAWLRRRW
jgi:HEPN domain-containing protein